MPPCALRRPRRRVRVLVALSVCFAVAIQALIGAGGAAAAALPSGAYWYTVLDLPHAWTITKGAGVTVAVVEGGVSAKVGDLNGQVLPGLDLTGRNPRGQSEQPQPGTKQFGHGTDMAVLIAGTGRGGGLVGVAPKAKILPVAVDNGHGEVSDTLGPQGIKWAVDHGADVINLSFAGASPCESGYREAIAYAYRHDVIVVAGAGDSPGAVQSPANCPGALAVGGVDSAFTPWTKTPSGPEIDFVAPAFNLVNEELDGTLNGPFPDNAGTSQATAIVSGTLALLRARFPKESARQIVTRALYNVHNGLGSGTQGKRINNTLGYGEILPYFALTEAPPANAANPIYDRFAAELNTPPSTGASNSASTTTPAASTPPSQGPATSANASSGGGTSVMLVILVVAVALLGLGAILFAVRRGRRVGAPHP
ncbi:MAG: putative family peptidase [Jatrophihabitans sp.]|nr:putative family peptidase [Jatrophihabitans sp.]